MISKLILHNWQSHPHTEVDFSEGVTSIIGESDHGKTALLRGLEWVWKNRPSGNERVSHWATKTDKKGKITLTDRCYGTVVFSDGRYVTREKNQDGFNGYYVGKYLNGEFLQEQEFGTVGTSVPRMVEEIFNMQDVNYQKQHDSMFLLSDSGQDVARYFNKLIKLDVSDTALSLSESKKRAAKKEKVSIEKELEELNDSLKKLEWTDEAIKLVEKIEMSEEKIKGLEIYLDELDELILNIESIKDKCSLPEWYLAAETMFGKIDSIEKEIVSLDDDVYDITVLEKDIEELHYKIKNTSWIPGAEEVIEKIADIDASSDKLSCDISEITTILENISRQKDIMKNSEWVSLADPKTKEINELNSEMISILEEIDDIELLMVKWEKVETSISSGTQELDKIKLELPERCVLCGAKLEGGDHVINSHS